ncbi:MAG: bifunctional oligoribonuclease/PAP phosphatase NrnA [Oscillospiraceae bacterium]
MSTPIDKCGAAEMLVAAEDILIITHKNPDGDTLGCGYAMCAALHSLGKRARVVCDSEISVRYEYMYGPIGNCGDFEPKFVLVLDTATLGLMGDSLAPIGASADLCIDHHGTNEGFARFTLCESSAASNAEVVGDVLGEMKVQITPYIANCLYTGVSTDTGCFRYANTTASSHQFAARLFECGCEYIELNRILFETKSRERFKLEQLAIAGMEFALDGKLAFITVTLDMLARAGCSANEVDGITALPRIVEGVEAGVTLRELGNGNWKVSVRTVSLDAARISENFGGGGHKRAAGFECSGSAYDVKCAVTAAVEGMLGA